MSSIKFVRFIDVDQQSPEYQARVSRSAELPRQPLAELDVTVSRHPAPRNLEDYHHLLTLLQAPPDNGWLVML